MRLPAVGVLSFCVACAASDTVDTAVAPVDRVAVERSDATLDLIERLSGHWFQGMLVGADSVGPALISMY